GQHALGVVLTDYVGVENRADLRRARHTVPRLDQRVLVLLADDVHAQLDAFIADEYGRARNQLADLMLALAAERAVKRVLFLGHPVLSTPFGRSIPLVQSRSLSPVTLCASGTCRGATKGI